jgi:hypothetical protein
VSEGTYKTQLTETIYKIFGSRVLVVRLDANLMQGLPDMGLLFEGGFWAMLEAKTSMNSKRQPNQPWYVNKMNELCFGAFICPENEEAVLNELQQEFEHHWQARLT